MEPEDSEIRQTDSDLQNASDADSEAAWGAMAEGRWRWGTRGPSQPESAWPDECWFATSRAAVRTLPSPPRWPEG
eukprot:5675034-Alexandrium_andersonii.AAC.1